MEVLLNINTWETFRYQPITFYNGYTLCKYEVLMSSRCLCIRVWVCVYQIPISCSLWVIEVGAKMSVLNTGVSLGEGWVGGSLLTLRCAEKLTHFYHGLKAPVCHTFDWSMFNVWLSDCIEIQILSTGAFRYGSTLAFTLAPSITHLMDVLVWISDWTQIMFTELLSYRPEFCLFDITGCNLKAEAQKV